MKSAFEIPDMAVNSFDQATVLRPGALHELFETQAVRRPNAEAVIFGREKITYAGLERHANRIARHLRRRGAGRGSVVAMLLPRSIEAYASILGILKSGAA